MKRASLLFVIFVSLLPALAAAEVLVTEGIAGDIDKHQRGPRLSVSTESGSNGVKILADADLPNDEFKKYPLRFDFFINRRLFSSQYRSPELPGAVGVDIGTDIATPPFNYVVVATVLHPNRGYTTVLQGAVFDSNLSATFDCTLTTGALSETESESFSATGISTVQSGNSALSFSFEGTNIDGDRTTSVNVALSVSGESASGTAILTEDGNASTVQLSGDLTFEDGTLTGLALASEDSETELDCD